MFFKETFKNTFKENISTKNVIGTDIRKHF